jgi:hypothetical protein
MASYSKIKVRKTETMTGLSDWIDVNQTYSQCHPLNLPLHQARRTQDHTIHQWRKKAGGAMYISE